MAIRWRDPDLAIIDEFANAHDLTRAEALREIVPAHRAWMVRLTGCASLSTCVRSHRPWPHRNCRQKRWRILVFCYPCGVISPDFNVPQAGPT